MKNSIRSFMWIMSNVLAFMFPSVPTVHGKPVVTNGKIKWGLFVTDGRGKVGGHVLSKNRTGAYIRTKVTPVNPQTALQSAVRAAFTSFSQAWRGLTASQILAWNNAVSDFQKTDIFGDLKKPTGKNLYLALNRNLDLVGGVNISDPPQPSGTFEFSGVGVAAAAGAGTVSVSWTSGAVPANMAVLVEAAPGISPGAFFAKNLFRYITFFPAADVTPTAIGAAYTALFGAMTAGKRISVRVTPVNFLTGERGTPTIVQSIIAA